MIDILLAQFFSPLTICWYQLAWPYHILGQKHRPISRAQIYCYVVY